MVIAVTIVSDVCNPPVEVIEAPDNTKCISGSVLTAGNKTVKYPDLSELALSSLFLWCVPPWGYPPGSVLLSEESLKGKMPLGVTLGQH